MRSRIAPDYASIVGRTPLVYLNKLVDEKDARIAAKLEYYNPSGSIKDRIVYNMITDAEKRGFLKPGSTIIEPTSGNTGISLAFMCAVRGYRLILTMPDTMSLERRKILELYGTELIITPGESGMKGAIEKAEELVEEISDVFMPQQFNNPSNPEAHEKTTAVEIWDDTAGEIDILVAGVGTGGTITGSATYLQRKRKKVLVVAVEPAHSAVLSGGVPGKHKIQGIGPGFIPKVLKRELIDDVITVTDEDALQTANRLARIEGIPAGISSGAAAYAAMEVAKKTAHQGKLIVVIFPDSADKYISMGLMK